MLTKMPSNEGVSKSPCPPLDAGPQKDRPYQSDFYRAGFNAIPPQAREQDSFDTLTYKEESTKRLRYGK